jgi:hypothetical protein
VPSNKLEDQVFWYKASDHPPFKMCDDSLWADNKPFSSSMLAQDEFDPTKVQKRNAGRWIHVKKEWK